MGLTGSEIAAMVQAGVLDSAAAERIRDYQETHNRSRRWLVVAVLVAGGLLVSAGILLFVEAHWDKLAPGARYALLAGMVAAFHGAGVALRGSPRLALTLHALGTVALGAGIFLAGQIFHLQTHWPQAFLLWALGAAAGWLFLRHWSQAVMVALLAPVWLYSERFNDVGGNDQRVRILIHGIALLAFAYVAATGAERRSTFRRALALIGSLALVPAVIALGAAGQHLRAAPESASPALDWAVALPVPLAVGLMLRGKQAWPLLCAAAWVLGFGYLSRIGTTAGALAMYAWAALGSASLVGWGMLDRQPGRVNVGVIGFGLSVLFFYFSNVMNKLDRSVSLIGLGVLFLVGGWVLEQGRRQLLSRMESPAA